MPAEIAIPENIRSLLNRADLSLLLGKHGQASTLLWKATEAAIQQAALARGHRLHASKPESTERIWPPRGSEG